MYPGCSIYEKGDIQPREPEIVVVVYEDVQGGLQLPLVARCQAAIFPPFEDSGLPASWISSWERV